jgi:cell wall-associated NlpC family hydrolase
MPANARMRHIAALPVLVVTVLAATLFASSAPASATTTRAQRVYDALQVVRAQKGDPYRYGAAGPGAFDCSGLVYYSFRRAGFSVPRTSSQQASAVRRIARTSMHPGDLMFFTSGGHVYHVGVFAGWANHRRYVLHAPHSGTVVRREALWTNSWFPGTLR